jgi:SRSO17 transposase
LRPRAAERLTAGQAESDVVLIVDETGDAKTGTDCAGAARQYSGTLGAIALCQVAVTLTCAAPAGHALIGRALYLPTDWAADEERREVAGVPDEVMFATKPQLAGTLLQQAHDRGIRAGFIAGNGVYGGLDLRTSIRERDTGYVLAVRSNHMVTLPSGRRFTVKAASSLVKPAMWQRMRTGSATKGASDYHWAMIEITPDDTPGGHRKITSSPSRSPSSTPARSPPGPPGTAGQRSACSPTPSSPSPPPGSAPATQPTAFPA